MSIERNKQLVFRFFEELMSLGHTEVADEIIGPDFPPQEKDLKPGPEGIKAYVDAYHAGFPDLRYDVQSMVAEGNQVAVRWTMTGIHEGEFMGISPTSEPISIPGMSFFDVEGSRLIQGWIIYDHLALYEKLGALPMTERVAQVE
ncbi:MAG: ester cyclase [Chloroflexi bacterium]|jgi:predicted ester cyclase|nr:ester cyclase [Chloroflexota bacterium]